jgi:hypothetical protein
VHISLVSQLHAVQLACQLVYLLLIDSNGAFFTVNLLHCSNYLQDRRKEVTAQLLWLKLILLDLTSVVAVTDLAAGDECEVKYFL